VKVGIELAHADGMSKRYGFRFGGDAFYQPRKRPHWRGNPIADPVVVTGRIAGKRARDKPRARDRKEFEPVDVSNIRKQFGQSRSQFAAMMGISRETLRNWERGRRYPVGPSRALLRIAAADPDVVAAVLVRNRASWSSFDPDQDY
jgi:DNA-binding transcriptional regulator YiaG